MNTDTTRAVNTIKNQGFWVKGQTLGEGGWGAVYSFATQWNDYDLINLDDSTIESICNIHASDDETAKKAFSSLFSLGEFAHEIYRNEHKSTLILEQL